MNFMHKASIRKKLIFITLGVSSVILIALSIMESVWDKNYFKQELRKNSLLTVSLIADNLAAPIIFESEQGVNDVLGKLNNLPDIIYARVTKADGFVYSAYQQQGSVFILPENAKIIFNKYQKGKLYLKKAIQYQDQYCGELIVVITTRSMDKKILANVLRLILFILGLSLFSFILASRMQRVISKPIIHLAHLASEISEKEDYSVRAQYQGTDEIGVLYSQFNKMLEQIQIREEKQKIAEKNLAAIVNGERKKTEELESAYTNLNQSRDAALNLLEDLRIEIDDREIAEKALRESEASITSIFRAAPIGIGLVQDRVLKRVNDRFCAMMQYSREELIDKNARMLYPSDEEYENVGKEKYAQISKYGTGSVETKLKRKDGQILDVLLSSTPNDRADLSKGVTFTVVDITSRKKMEKALIESEKRYRTLFNNAPIGIGLANFSGKVVAANVVMEQVTGYTLEEFQSVKLADTYANSDERDKLISLLSRNGSIRNYETQLIRKDGTIFDVRMNIDVIELGDDKVILTTAQDISESKRIEETLREERAQLLSIFDSIEQMVYVADTETYEVLYMNSIMRQWLNTDGTSGICFKLFQNKDGPCDFCTNKIILENNYQPYTWEHHNPVLDKDFLIMDRLIRWPDGRDVRFELAIDITDRKAAEAEIRKLNIELEQRVKDRTQELESVNKELEAFSYSVSHDLRAPLRHVSGFVDLLARNMGVKIDSKNKHYIEVIQQSAQRMGNLIDELLQFSRTGRAEIIKKQFDCMGLIREVIDEITPEAEGRTIAWDVSELPEIYADPLKIRHVFLNLLSNAIKFTRNQNNPVIKIDVQSGQNADYIFSVQDNGVGFDMKYVDKLFGVFQRLHRAEEFEGNGIGLANVRRIIHRHGGRTWAEGKLNEGATFFFSLPKQKKG